MKFQKGNKLGHKFQKGNLFGKGNKFEQGFKKGHSLNIEEGNNQWKGGVSSIFIRIRRWSKYKNWKKKIFERDNFSCQKCGKMNELQPHHIILLEDLVNKYNIKNYAEGIACKELWNLENGITLCKNCHWKEHSNKKWA